MDAGGALLPSSARDTKDLLDIILGQEVVGWGHIIAEWWLVALLSDVINIESWFDWVSEDDLHEGVTNLKGNWPDTGLDQSLASLESSPKDIILGLANELVLEGEGVVCWVLGDWVDEAVTDSDSLEVDLQVSLVLEHEVVGNGGDIVTGI